MVAITPSYIATVCELIVGIINLIIMIPYYWKNKWTIISYCHMVFGVVYLANQIITFALILNGNATTFCGAWNLQVFILNAGNYKEFCRGKYWLDIHTSRLFSGAYSLDSVHLVVLVYRSWCHSQDCVLVLVCNYCATFRYSILIQDYARSLILLPHE